MPYSIVAMGTSWGGLSAMMKLLGGLPEEFPIPIVVVQHRSKDSDRLLVQLLQDATPLKVCEIEDKDGLFAGTVHIAPANYHILIESGYASLTTEEAVRFSRPSIDVMFSSAADTYRSETIGVVLTGANEDGASGLAHIVKRGGRALIQDPKTAEIPIMPDAAIRAVPTAEVIPLTGLAPRLIELSREGVKAKRSASA
ncbi:MAG TPA: chemotaxis protein CheB [Gemmatimonadaceae bacterium]|nr:chemotaxis protein CheB [Gemmatimonadaceae bacterium]